MNDYNVSVVLISVTDTEDYGIKYLYKDWEEFYIAGDEQKYFRAHFEKDGKTHVVVYAKQKEMGMTAGAALATKMIMQFRPSYIIMTGIAAGVALENGANDQIYGDVIVANEIWEYASGKFVNCEKADISFGNVGFIPRPKSIKISDSVIESVKKAVSSDMNQNHIFIGPMACGTAVIANKEILNKQVHSQMPDTVGLDMESYAIAYAAQNAPEPKPLAIIIKSVCDYADSSKGDLYQKFAACTAAEFSKLLYEMFLEY